MNAENIKNLLLVGLAQFGGAMIIILTALILIGVGFLVFSVGKRMIINGDFGATIDHMVKPKWKGYKIWRSEKWNMEHTL